MAHISRAHNPKYLKIIIIAKADKVNAFRKGFSTREMEMRMLLGEELK